MAPDDRNDDDQTDDVLGIARGPVAQTEEDRAIAREPGPAEGAGLEPDEVDTRVVNDETGYGVPKGPSGLHVED
jgi:hypothetical protein